ncbi:MAG: TRAP transporter small permease [Desulfobacula sp.]|jgi:TRAP-type C4-dicarboxylate transport system permease small subunit|nr:TRAP transporter small permease [Desulfobacula sp.]
MEKMMKIFDQVLKIMMFIAGILLIFIMLSVCMEVILRTFFDVSLMWITEVTEIMLLYITFLGSAWVLREEGHVKVDIILSRLKPRIKAFLGIISSILGIFVSLILTGFGFKVALDCLHKSAYTPTAMEIPMALIIIIIPIGCLMLFLQFIRRTLKYVAGFIIESNRVNSKFET